MTAAPGRRYPGDLIEIGRERLHVVVDGVGEPAVLLLGGLGEPWFDWDPTVALLQVRHRVVRYDRPGLGGSPPAAVRPTLVAEAERIAAVIDSLQLAQPVVVAHSVAALPAEAYARSHPGGIRGLVLVDPSWEPAARPRSRFAAQAAACAVRAAAAGLRAADRIGLSGRLGPQLWGLGRRMMARDRSVPAHAGAVWSQGWTAAAAFAELVAYRDWGADLQALRRVLPPPSMPVRVLTALGDLRSERRKQAWLAGHAQLAGLFPDGRQVVLPAVGHLVGLDDPDAVAAAVQDVVASSHQSRRRGLGPAGPDG